MDPVFVIHLLILFTIVSIPVWPIQYLKYGVYIPLILSAIWLFFDGCPITKLQHDIEKETFVQYLVKKYIYPSVTLKQCEHLVCFSFLLITVIGFHRLISI